MWGDASAASRRPECHHHFAPFMFRQKIGESAAKNRLTLSVVDINCFTSFAVVEAINVF
jgi:hypothetical protein